jgi:hypothetical protein
MNATSSVGLGRKTLDKSDVTSKEVIPIGNYYNK